MDRGYLDDTGSVVHFQGVGGPVLEAVHVLMANLEQAAFTKDNGEGPYW